MKQVEVDIAIIGAGTAGLAAGIAAAENGARVAIFDKSSTTGGTGNMGMGPFAVESRLQRLKQIALTREEAFRTFMDYTHWRVDARLVKAYIDKSASTIDWLENMGVEFVEPAAYFPGANFTWHLVKSATGSFGSMCSSAMMKIMTDTAKKAGVRIFLQTSVVTIIKQGGIIAGVIVEEQSGEQTTVKAGAVVIATGGFGDNPEWIKKYTGYSWGHDIYSMRIPGMVGDGIRMAWGVGAGQSEMNMEIIYEMPSQFADKETGGQAPPGVQQMLTPMDVAAVFRQPNLAVNLLGERFMNEGIIGNTTFTGNAIARQKNRCAFVIFDEEMKYYYEQNGLDVISLVHPVMKLENFELNMQEMMRQGNPNLFKADSIEELASQTGINSSNLQKTVGEYNQACDTGRDVLFNKKSRYLRPIRKAKFYAGRFFTSAYGSLGGIKINYKTEVVTKDFDVIPGLYAAGTDACSIYGDSYVFVLPGNTMGFALNSGRIAGENAAAYVKSKQ